MLALLHTKGDLEALVPDLPERQLQVILLLVNDWLKLALPATFSRIKATNENAMIALALGISETTVRRHLGEARLRGEMLGYDPSAVLWHPNVPRKVVGGDLSEEEWEEQKAQGRRKAGEAWKEANVETERQRKEWAKAKGRKPREGVVCLGQVFALSGDVKVRRVRRKKKPKRVMASSSYRKTVKTRAHWLCSHGYDPFIHVHHNYDHSRFLRLAYARYERAVKKELALFKAEGGEVSND